MPVPVIVLNFGHSVLRSLDDYTQAASEIYRHYRQGQNVKVQPKTCPSLFNLENAVQPPFSLLP